MAALRVSLVSVSRDYSLVVCRLLTAVASHGAQALERRLSSCDTGA